MDVRFFERLRLDGEKVDADVTGRLISAQMVRAYDSATSLELVLDDHDFRILTSGLVSRRGKVANTAFDAADWARFGDTRLVLDGIAFRLAGVGSDWSGGQGHRLTLTFEDELAVLMRAKKGPKRIRRGNPGSTSTSIPFSRYGDTRASAIMSLVIEALAHRPGQPPFFSVNADKVQPVKQATGQETPVQQDKGVSAKTIAKDRQKGLAGWRKLRVKGVVITAAQKANIETALIVADEQHATNRVAIAMLCAGIGESSFVDQMNQAGSGFGGVFQGQVAVPGGSNWFAGMGPDERTREQAKSFLLGGRGYQGGGAIKLAGNPNMGPGEIALAVEVSGKAPSFYGTWATEAQTILDAWGAAAGAAGTGRVITKAHPYYFTVAKRENYFAAASRLAAEVNWRFWVDQNQVWYVPDAWLFKSATNLTFTPTTEGVRGLSGQADVGVKVGELLVTVNLPRWVGAPAWRCEVDDMGPFDGLWLLAVNEQDLITEDCTVTLRRPAPALKSPRRRSRPAWSPMTRRPAAAAAQHRWVIRSVSAAR